jgi:hypothetical protein
MIIKLVNKWSVLETTYFIDNIEHPADNTVALKKDCWNHRSPLTYKKTRLL